MKLHECGQCTALFASPSGPECPACGHSGPSCTDVSGGGNGYENNWYRLVETVGGVA